MSGDDGGSAVSGARGQGITKEWGELGMVEEMEKEVRKLAA